MIASDYDIPAPNQAELDAAEYRELKLAAFRALGMLSALYTGGDIPEMHREQARDILNAAREL